MDLKYLERKLGKNYDKIVDESVAGDVLWFMETYPNVQELECSSIRFIKKFSKVVSNLIIEKKYLSSWQANCEFSCDQLRWINDYNKLSIDKILSFDFDENKLSQTNLLKILGHFYSHNANIKNEMTKHLPDKKEKIEVLKKACEDFQKCIEICSEIDSEHAMHQYNFLAGAALKIAELSDEKEQKIGWYQKTDRFCEIYLNSELINDPEAKAFRISTRGDIYEKMAETENSLEGMIKNLKKSYDYYNQAFETSKNEKFVVYQSSFKARAAEKTAGFVSDEKEKIEWYKISYENRKKTIEGIIKYDEKSTGHQLSYNAEVAEKLAGLLENERQLWLENAYNNNVLGAKIVKPHNEKHSFITLMNAGRNAAELFLMTKELGMDESELWKGLAIKAYNQFIDYVDRTNDPSLMDVKTKSRYKVRELEGRPKGKSKKLKTIKKNREKQERRDKNRDENRDENKDSKRYKRARFDWKKTFKELPLDE